MPGRRRNSDSVLFGACMATGVFTFVLVLIVLTDQLFFRW
jgi:hypothetical protein